MVFALLVNSSLSSGFIVDYDDVQRRDIKNVLPTAVGSTFLKNRLPQTPLYSKFMENGIKNTLLALSADSKKPLKTNGFLTFGEF